ncbi:flavodoxin family protein [uncultured Ellagibacter sp.]|mgnify:FL=1|uniref:flavodoxin family protein n=1 Tax=uncultured Ellagibacter sp. TaxID=2137580 RepID=UPI002636B6D7|nr:NAD(P)H-dependent oxidoreductase [uncultured Ellagibacter sp.]
MNRLIIVGSPRTDGRSAHLANMLFETCIEECPDDELALAPVSTLSVAGCMGCDACRDNIAKLVELGEEALEDDFAPCVIDDDMQEIYELIDSADEITVVSPVYFAGPPSQLKALLDRLQPYYWTNARAEEKRPAVLHAVGEGGDPHGFSALVTIVRSALAVAGFRLETVFDWVGKIDNDGEITAEAEVYSIEDFFAAVDSAVTPVQGAEGDGAAIIEFPQAEGAPSSGEENSPEPGSSRGPRGGARTRLSLDDAGGAKSPHAKSASRQGGGKKPASANGKPKGSHPGGGSRKSEGSQKSRGAQGKRGSQQGGARTKGAAKKGNSKKGNGRG